MRAVELLRPWLTRNARRARAWLLPPPDPRDRYRFALCAADVVIGDGLRVEQPEGISLGPGVELDRDVWLHVEPGHADGVRLEIGRGSYVGMRTILSAARRVVLGERVFLGHGVLVTDHNHAYADPTRAIADQGIAPPGAVEIGDGSWVGVNAALIGAGRGLTIGRGCVVGANAVVLESVPDHTVVAGNPARPVKRLDPVSGRWLGVDGPR